MATIMRGQNKSDDDEMVIYLGPILKALRKRLIWIILVAVLCGALAYFATLMFTAPKYRTTFTVYVNNALDSSDKTSISNSDLTASRSLALTYAEIIKGRTVMAAAASEAGIEAQYSTLSKMVNVNSGTTTEIITVNVTTVSPELSKRFADCIIDVSKAQVSSIVDGSSMRVIDEPYLPTGIYSPNYKRNTLIGAFLGAFILVVIIVLREILDNRVRDEQTLAERFGVAILGSIPNQTAASKAGGHYYSYGYENAGKEANKK